MLQFKDRRNASELERFQIPQPADEATHKNDYVIFFAVRFAPSGKKLAREG
ncbi:hypothetical protein LPW26_06645 [Rhodopseudomonas sp. HC1]|uniref:hypothetical protein n=1 Tax=Rhodopseudomonas infernalis TaxID=2897386 RepID=UPI001EE8C6C6|nr:hypothetical protein [Rhodopseudomonas infernalis]MCG6204306.1 hypothetical protein [Rhodopseudomonas infernalis]